MTPAITTAASPCPIPALPLPARVRFATSVAPEVILVNDPGALQGVFARDGGRGKLVLATLLGAWQLERADSRTLVPRPR